jgi:hypothetical protein
MTGITRRTRELHGYTVETLPLTELLAGDEPVVLKGLVAQWPLVQAGLRSHHEAMSYLRSFYNGKTVGTSRGDPQIQGRLFYNQDYTQLNFLSQRAPLDHVLMDIEKHLEDERPPTNYIASTTIDACLPGFAATTTYRSSRMASRRSPASGSAIAPSRPVTTTRPTTWRAAPSGGGASRCFHPSRFSIYIRGRWSPRRAARRSAWWILPIPISSAFHASAMLSPPVSSPKWSLAMRYSFRVCGGITSKH